MERIAGSRFRLSTGREFYANHHLVSLQRQSDPYGGADYWEIGEGYDGSVHEDAVEWTSAERRELADYMIALWTQFRNE